jgi:hypothetical protein
MRPVRNVFQKLSRTEQRREGVVAYLWKTPSHILTEWYKKYRPIHVPIMDGQEGWGGASHKISWRLQHLFSRAERKHACLHIYLQYEIKTYRPYSRYRVTRLCSDSLCIFPCNETHLLLKEKYCKMLKGKIRKPSKYRIILFEDLRNLLIMLNLKISIPVTNNATKFLKI